MRVIGFSFGKINIERFKETSESLKYNTKIDISNIEPLNSDFLKTKGEILKISFVYSVTYDPEYAKLELAGSLLLSVEPRIAREILKSWKDKEISEDFRLFIFNVIIRKSNIKALQLEDDLGLPPHIPLPTLRKPEPKEESQPKQ